MGLHEVARKRVGTFSLGMGQRLGIAAALLADPGILILDEPANGLDPEGIQWIRGLLKELAAEGRTVFVSSHVMSEMALVAEHLIVIGRGRLIADLSVEEFVRRASRERRARPFARGGRLADVLSGPDVSVEQATDGSLEVAGLTAEQVGELAASHLIVLHELTPVRASLEEAFMDVTRDEVEFAAAAAREHDRSFRHRRSRPPGRLAFASPRRGSSARSGRSSARSARPSGRCSSPSC